MLQLEKPIKKRDVRLSTEDLSSFCVQTAMLLKAGISVAEGMGILCEDSGKDPGGAVLDKIYEHVEKGEPFFMALEASGAFPRYMINMVRIGELSGRLEEALDSLHTYYEWEESVSQSIRGAVAYPLMMIIMMAAVIGVLVMKVLPVFNEVFRQLGGEMSGAPRAIMRLGELLGRYSLWILGAAVATALILFILRRAGFQKRTLSRLFASGRLPRAIASGRFASAMAMMLSSGLEADKALALAGDLIDNPILNAKIIECRRSVQRGDSFCGALTNTGIFTGVYARMLSVSFRAGSVDVMFRRLARYYEREIDLRIDGLVSMLEPTLVAVLSAIVGMILLSVMLPLMGILSSIG